MRNFNWETLPKHCVVGKHNIWTVDGTDGGYELDTDGMEELFSHKQQQEKALHRRSVRGLAAGCSGGELVSILDSKRSMNIGIFLKQFKRPLKDMIEDIKSGRSHGFGCGKLQEMCKLLPDKGEVKQLVGFKGERSALPEADLFMLLLIQIPCYEERLNCLVLKEEFSPLMKEMKEVIRTLTSAGRELLESDHLHSVIRLVLKTGNYMNAGGYAGSAIGFRMSSLLKLADTKANKPGMNLMHYVVMQAQKADMALLKFSEQLQHVEAGARINKDDIEADFKIQLQKVESAKTDAFKREDLKAQMEDFLKEAEVWLSETEAELEELQSVSDSVAEYFCEDPQNFKLDECCSIFHSFCERFMKAMQENKAREVAEVKRRHRERLQNAAKRRSTATCSSRDKEMDGVALESILQRFLNKPNSRRRSGKSSSGQESPSSSSPNSGSPSLGSLTEITSKTNLPPGNQKVGDALGAKGRKEWKSAFELTQASSQSEAQISREDSDDSEEAAIVPQGETKTSNEEDSEGFTPPDKTPADVSSAVRPLSSISDDEKEDLQDNTEEEAQKLREASKKVLHYQRSRGSVSSGEHSLESVKSPGPIGRLPRQHTFDEATKRTIEDQNNDDLFRFVLDPQTSAKRNLSRRHTLPSKVPKTEEEEDDVWTQPLVRSPKPAAQEKGPLSAGRAGLSSTKFNFTDIQDLKSPSAEQKNNPSACLDQSHEGSLETNQAEKHLRVHSENIPPRTTWFKTESQGMFYSLFKRFGDMSKQQNSKETIHKATGTGV